MICRVELDLSGCGSIATRRILFNWAILKLIINAILLCFSVYEMSTVVTEYYSIQGGSQVIAVFGILAGFFIADIVFQAKLNIGLKKKRVDHLKEYYIYSQVLWMLMPIFGVSYALLSYNSLLDHVTNDISKRRRVTIQLYAMFISLLFQTIAMLLVKREIDNLEGNEATNNETDQITNNKKQIFDTEFTLNIDNDAVKGTDNDVAEIETTCEKAKLTE